MSYVVGLCKGEGILASSDRVMWKIMKIRTTLFSPRIMLLLDFDFSRIILCKELLACMLTATSTLIALSWKSEEKPLLKDWVGRIR